MSGRLRVAVAGSGYFSRFHFDAWSRCPEVDLVGVASLDETEAKAVAQDYGMPVYPRTDALLKATKPDVLDIVTPPQTHKELIDLALRHGADVVCQKPFCGTYEAALRIEKALRDHDENRSRIDESPSGIERKVTVHENFRFQPWYAKIRSEIEGNLLGRIFQATFRLRPGDGQGAEAYLERQPYFQTMDRFLVHETAIHFVDVFRYIFGEPDAVQADLRQLNPAIAGEDACLITMNFDGGLRAVIDGNRLSDHRAKNPRLTMGEMMVEGERGVLFLNGDAELTFRPHGKTELQPISYEWNDRGFGGDCVYRFTRHVVDHYCHGGPRVNSASDYLRNLHIEEAIYASSKSGNRIAIT